MRDVKIDQDTCIGCGMCESTCPKIFQLNNEGKSTIVKKFRKKEEDRGEIPDDIGCLEDAEDNCPVSAIAVS